MVKRIFIVVIMVALMVSLAYAQRSPADVEVVIGQDLQADGKLAERQRLPLLLMFSMHGCSYCEIVEEDFLRPMLISGDYDDKVIIRKLMTDSYETVRDFNGKQVQVVELAGRYNASLTPTVIFVNARGELVAERLIGLTTPDFYGGDLDDQIEIALQRIRRMQMARNSLPQ